MRRPQTSTLAVFPVAPYGLYASVVEHVTLPPLEATRAIAWWQDILLASPRMQCAGHYPTHGIRFRRGNYVVFETTVCWKCRTFWLHGPNGTTWIGLPHPVITEPARVLFLKHFAREVQRTPLFPRPASAPTMPGPP